MADHQTHIDEQQLLVRIANGDQAAFAVLIDRYWTKIYGQAMAYIKSAQAAEELTQDIFMDLWHSREKLPAIEQPANYLFIVARNKIFNALRKKLETMVDVDKTQLEEDLWLPHMQMERKELYAILLTGIDKMPPVRRQVFTMSRLEGRSYEEIGQELQISRNTIKEHIVKALNYLRTHLAAHGGYLKSLLIFFLLYPPIFFENVSL